MQTFEEFYRSNVRMVYAVAMTRVGEVAHAEDLTQETFLRAWQRRAQLVELAPAAGRAWLLTTLRNLAIDLWRRQEWQGQSEEQARGMAAAHPASPELRMDVLHALSELPHLDREITVLRFILGMNSREIGETLDMPDGTVRRRLAGCRRRLARCLKSWGPEGKTHEQARR